jgi:hypothetical protein
VPSSPVDVNIKSSQLGCIDCHVPYIDPVREVWKLDDLPMSPLPKLWRAISDVVC